MPNKSEHIIIIPIIVVIIIFSVWILCYPLSTYMAENNFENYMIEYNIDKSDIESYNVRKNFAFSPVDIVVVYKSEPEYVYSYSYPICYFISNKPEYVSIKSNGVWYSSTEIYESLEHPAISLRYP